MEEVEEVVTEIDYSEILESINDLLTLIQKDIHLIYLVLIVLVGVCILLMFKKG